MDGAGEESGLNVGLLSKTPGRTACSRDGGKSSRGSAGQGPRTRTSPAVPVTSGDSKASSTIQTWQPHRLAQRNAQQKRGPPPGAGTGQSWPG